MEDLQLQLTALLADVEKYNDTPDKSCSKRIRMALGLLKKQTTNIRKDLVDRDKAGY